MQEYQSDKLIAAPSLLQTLSIKHKKMILKPTIGIDQIQFGMNQDEIVSILGIPDKNKIDSDNENQIILEFNSLKLRLTLYKDEQKRLGYISTTNPDIEFKGKKIIDKNIDAVINNVFNDLEIEWKIDEYDFWETYSDYKYWITLNVEFKKVNGVELGVSIDENDNYVWPKKISSKNS